MSTVFIKGSVDRIRPTNIVYIKIPYNGIEISLSIPTDGRLASNADLRVYSGPGVSEDLTMKVFGEINYAAATAENIRIAMDWIDANVA